MMRKLHVGDVVDLDGFTGAVVALTDQTVSIRGVDDGAVRETLIADLWRSGSVAETRRSDVEMGMDILDRLGPLERQRTMFWVEELQALEGQLGLAEVAGVSKTRVMDEAARRIGRAGHPISSRSLYRKLLRYRTLGVPGLVHARVASFAPPTRRVDQRVVDGLAEVMESQRNRSTGTRSRLIELTRQLLAERYGIGTVMVPSRATMYRLISALDRGTHVTGSAKTRRSLANRPQRQFLVTGASRPGEQVQIDSTKLDVLIELPDGARVRPELTIMLDVATRSIVASIVQPTTKSIDLVVLLARALTPSGRRPGGETETRRLVSESLEQPMLDDAGIEEYRRRMPVIFPSTITTDRGAIFVSRHFREVCQQLGIDLNMSAPFTPTDKAMVERTFKSINTRFTQYLAGYTGRGVEHRGTADDAVLLSLPQLQQLVDDWVAVDWQERPHDALRDPIFPSRTASPNEIARAARQLIPEVVIPMDETEYIRLMPRVWRTIQSYGVTIDNRTYDSRALAPYRRTTSPYQGPEAGKWPIRQDPYNIQVVWLELPDGLIPLHWTSPHLSTPLSSDVWNAHRSDTPGRDPQKETRRAAHLAALLSQAAHPRKPDPKLQRAIARNNAIQTAPRPIGATGPIAPARQLEAAPSAESPAAAGEEWASIAALPPLGLLTDDEDDLR